MNKHKWTTNENIIVSLAYKNKYKIEDIHNLLPQLSLILLISIYFGVKTAPSLINLDYRDEFMKKNSFEYTGIKWANDKININYPVISELRSHALLSNEFIPLENVQKLQETNKYIEYLKLKNPKFIITKRKNFKDHFLKECIGKIHKVSQDFNNSTRNPFNRGGKYKIYIYHFNFDKLNYCTIYK